MSVPDVMTPDEAAKALQLPKSTVLELCRRGILPSRKLGRNWRLLRAGLLEVFDRPPPVRSAAPTEATTPSR